MTSNNVGEHLLRERYPWPAERPEVADKRSPNGTIFGWFHGENRAVLRKLIQELDAPLVLELGALLGLSTHFLAEWAEHGTVITIDHWRGSREHQKSPLLADVLDRLYETFCVHLWDYRTRVVPMRTTTLAGMIELHDLGITPHIIYVDASHEIGPVYGDTMLALTLWPEAHVVGDDGRWTSIQAALVDVGRNTDRTITNHGCCWEIPPLGQRPTIHHEGA